MGRRFGPRAGAALLLASMVSAAAPAQAVQILDTVDSAEVAAEIAEGGVNRIALIGDRIVRVVRAPGAFKTEHDPATGDLYLMPFAGDVPEALPGETAAPVTLFIGTEKGFTYRLALTPVERESAQILIRNPAAAAFPAPGAGDGADARVAALVELVRAVARREPLGDYSIAAVGAAADSRDRSVADGFETVEVWRGPRFTAHVIEGSGELDAAALAARFEDAAAAWLAAPGTGLSGGRLAVVVVEHGGAGAAR